MRNLLVIDLPEYESIELYPLNDVHIGSILCNKTKFHSFIRHILEEPNRYIICLGDLINNNITGSVGSPWEDTISPREQKKLLKKELEPIKDRILLFVDGNHERRNKKMNDESPTEDIAEHFGITYKEEDAYLQIRFGKSRDHSKPISYIIYCTHGSGGGKRPGATINNLELLTLGHWAEIYIIAHFHRKLAYKAPMEMPDPQNRQIRNIEMLYVVSSSFQDFGGYAARKMMRPSSLGSTPIYMSGKEKYFEVRI
jgi:hypothetical protein